MAARRYMPELDRLRALAIALVMLHHLPAVIGRDLGLLQPLSAAGWFGVDIFFALSGFLITGILLSTVGRPSYWRNFYVRRALRILPLYYGFLTLIFLSRALAPLIPPEMTPSPWWFYGFLSNFWYAQKSASTDLALEITWSLSVEEQFYLVWPLLVCWLRRRTLTITLVVVVLTAPFFRLLLAHDAQTLCHTLCRMDGLAFGCLAALWWYSGEERRLRGIGSAAGALWITLLAVVYLGGFREDGWGVPVFLYALVPAAAATTILAVLSGQARLLSKLLALRPLVWIGRVSFSLYLLHPLCFNIARNLAISLGWRDATSHWGSDLVLALLAISLSLFAAGASFRVIEQRFLAFKDRLAPALANRAATRQSDLSTDQLAT